MIIKWPKPDRPQAEKPSLDPYRPIKPALEASILKIPAISLRENIERQEGNDEATILMSEINYEKLSRSIDLVLKMKK